MQAATATAGWPPAQLCYLPHVVSQVTLVQNCLGPAVCPACSFRVSSLLKRSSPPRARLQTSNRPHLLRKGSFWARLLQMSC